MSALSREMVNKAQSLDKDAAALTDSSIELRKILLELQPKVANVDSYTHFDFEEKWKVIRGEYDELLHLLNETARRCADTLEGYFVLLPEINNPAMFEDARVELRALTEKLGKDNSFKDLSDKFRQLDENIVQFTSDTEGAITKKQYIDNALSEARGELTFAKVAATIDHLLGIDSRNLMDTIMTLFRTSKAHNQAISASGEFASDMDDTTMQNQDVSKASPEAREQFSFAEASLPRSFHPRLKQAIPKAHNQATNASDEVRRLIELTSPENRLTPCREVQAKVDGQVRSGEHIDWPPTRTSLETARSLVGIVASKHYVINAAHEVLKAEVTGYLRAFDDDAFSQKPSNQQNLVNYHRRARDNEPKLRSIHISLVKFAFEFK